MDDKELLGIIDDAAKRNLTTLNLDHNQLMQLPPEMSKLPNLKQNRYYFNFGFGLKNNNFNVPDFV